MTTISKETMRQREAAALFLAASRKDGFSRSDGAEAMRCGLKQASYHLLLLCRAGRLKKIRGGKASRYCLPERAVDTLMFLEERDYAEKTAVRQVWTPKEKTRIEVPKRPISSVFALAEAMA
jgi:hypothetical protein